MRNFMDDGPTGKSIPLASAQCYLGVCYELGKGVSKDERLAVEWYTKAAEQGNTEAKKRLQRLGRMW